MPEMSRRNADTAGGMTLRLDCNGRKRKHVCVERIDRR